MGSDFKVTVNNSRFWKLKNQRRECQLFQSLYFYARDSRLNLEKKIKMVHQIKDMGDLQSQLTAAGGKLVVIDFFATWCGPCKMIAPKIEQMAGSMANVVFLKVDVDEAEDVAQEYNISAMPTFIFLKNGAKVADLMGANADKLTELVNKHA